MEKIIGKISDLILNPIQQVQAHINNEWGDYDCCSKNKECESFVAFDDKNSPISKVSVKPLCNGKNGNEAEWVCLD